MKKLLSTILALPALALLGGVGVLAYAIGETWTEADTQTLVAGLVQSCMVGAVILGLLLALIVGIPLAIRAYGESGRAKQQWREPAPPPMPAGDGLIIDGQWHRLPPIQQASTSQQPNVPPWQVTGGGQLDLMGNDHHLLPHAQQDNRFQFEANAQENRP